MIRLQSLRQWVGFAAVSGLLAGFGACAAADRLLQVDNPEQIQEQELNDEQLIGVLVNSAIGEFQAMYADPFIWRGSMFTDEQVTGINWEQTARLNLRIVRFTEGDANLMFGQLSRARAIADTASSRLRTLTETPNQDARLATTLAFAGYSYILLGEAMCEGTVNLSSRIYSSRELTEFAIPRLEEAIPIALAANRQDIANLARVGLTRAHLQLGNKEKVKEYAAQVPANFTWWVEYSLNSPREYNILADRVTGANHALGVHPKFLSGPFGQQNLRATQTDPRIQHTTNWTLGHNRLTRLYKPYQGLRFSGYNGETIAAGGQPRLYERDTDIQLASGLEARHNFAEADGPTAATLAFVNERRAVGNQPPMNLSGDALMAELREQRGRDFYMGGLRLGDLRRWKEQGTGDFFPQGQHPTEEWGQYSEATCFPLPNTEYEGNPNISRPGS